MAAVGWKHVFASAGFTSTSEALAESTIVPTLYFLSAQDMHVRVAMEHFHCLGHVTPGEVRRRVASLVPEVLLQAHVCFEVWSPLSLTVIFRNLSGVATLFRREGDVIHLTLGQVLLTLEDSIPLTKYGGQLYLVDKIGTKLTVNKNCWEHAIEMRPLLQNEATEFAARWPSSPPWRHKTLELSYVFVSKALRIVPFVAFGVDTMAPAYRLENLEFHVAWKACNQRTSIKKILSSWIAALIACEDNSSPSFRATTFAQMLQKLNRLGKLRDVFYGVRPDLFQEDEQADRAITFILLPGHRENVVVTRFTDPCRTRILIPTAQDLEIMDGEMRGWFASVRCS